MFDKNSFDLEIAGEIVKASSDLDLIQKARDFLVQSDKYKYGYYWTWLGLPIIQMPEDIILTQEILWETKPDFVIETGVAWGGSLAMYASFLEIQGHGKVFGIDVTMPAHNRERIMKLPVAKRINLIEGSSIDQKVFDQIAVQIPVGSSVLLVLDSNHTHQHVLAELKLWSKLVTKDNFIIVSDTIVEKIPKQVHRTRPWGPGDNPMTAMTDFLSSNKRFTNENKYSIRTFASFNPSGYLKCLY
jgi:cephalosporin hydroxylase